MTWISVKKKKPDVGQLVVVWMVNRKEPVCCRVEQDQHGLVFRELVAVDIYCDREDLVSHWIPLPEAPEEG